MTAIPGNLSATTESHLNGNDPTLFSGDRQGISRQHFDPQAGHRDRPLNVITAYSVEEAIGMLARFPAVDGIVLDTEVKGITCRELIRRLRAVRSDLPIVTVSPSGHDPCGAEDFHVSSYDPQDLLEQLNRICPKETREATEESDFPQ
jgi:CheY-like chemotaxis protein